MAADFRASALGGNGQSATTASLAVVIPATAEGADVALLEVESANDTVTLTTPTGWTLLSGPDRVGTSASGWLFRKVLDGTAGSASSDAGTTVTLAFSAAQRCSAQMSVYSGVTTTGLLFQSRAETASAGTTTLPSVGSVPEGALLHVSWLRRYGGTPAPNVTAPAGYSQGTNARSATGYGASPELSVEAAYKVVASAGTYGGETASVSSPSVGINYAVSLRPVVSDVTTVGVTARATAAAATGGSSNGQQIVEGVPARATTAGAPGDITGTVIPVDVVAEQWPPEPYREAIRHGLAVYYTVDATLAGQPIRDATALSPTGGTITDTNRPGVRRNLGLQFADPTGVLYSRLAPSGTRLTVTAHLRYTDRNEQTIPMGVYVVDSDRLSEASGQLSITAPDKWVIIQRAKFLKPQNSNRGQRITDQIVALIRGALGSSEAVIVTATSQARVAQLTWEQDRDQAIIDLADQIGAWVYFDRDGVATIADTPRAGAAAKWLIDSSASGVLVDIDREQSRAETANVVVVESSASDSAKFEPVVVWDSDPLSVTYAGPDPVNQPDEAGPFGIQPVFESSPNLETASQAAEFGGAVLARKRGLASQVSLEGVPNPALDAFDVIDVLPPGQEPTGVVGVDGFGLGGFGESAFGLASVYQAVYRSTREIERHIADTVTHPLVTGDGALQRIEGRSTQLVALEPQVPTTPTNPDPTPDPTPDPGPTPAPTSTIFGFDTEDGHTFNQTIAGRLAWWGRAPMVRRYHSGMLPATFAQTLSQCPERRLSISFKPEGTGSFSAAGLAAGSGNSRMVSWLESIPANWTVFWTYYHEVNDDIREGRITATQFKQTWTRMRAALNSASLNSGVTVKLVPNFMDYNLTVPAYWSDTWVPARADMDMLTFDIYGNPGGGGTSSTGSNRYGTATGTGYGTTYPLPEERSRTMFDIISRLGWAQHWGILEVNTPARSWDPNETARARWLKDMYDVFLAQPYDPEVVLLWEDPQGNNWDHSFGRISGNPTPCVNALRPYITGSP